MPISLGLENNVLVINQSPVFASRFGVMPTISPPGTYRPMDPTVVVAADLDDINGGGPLPLTQSEVTGIPGAPFPDPQNRAGMFPVYRDVFGLDNFHPGNGQPLGPGLFQFLPLSLAVSGNGQGLEGDWSNVYKFLWQSEDPFPRTVELTIESQAGQGAYTRDNSSDLKTIETVQPFTLPLRINLCPCEFGGDAAVIDVQDLLAFLSLWFVGDIGADFNNTGATDITDLLQFLSCWFPASNDGFCP